MSRKLGKTSRKEWRGKFELDVNFFWIPDELKDCWRRDGRNKVKGYCSEMTMSMMMI